MSPLARSLPQPRAAELEGLIQLIRHDRTNALLVVEGYLDVVCSLDDELARAAADALRRAFGQLVGHIDGLFLAWALDSGSVTAESGPVELIAFVASAASSLRHEWATATRISDREKSLVAWTVPGHLERALRNVLGAAHRSAVEETVDVSLGKTTATAFVTLGWAGPPPSEGAEEGETLDALSALELYTGGRLIELGGGSVTRTTAPDGQIAVTFSLPLATTTTQA